MPGQGLQRVGTWASLPAGDQGWGLGGCVPGPTILGTLGLESAETAPSPFQRESAEEEETVKSPSFKCVNLFVCYLVSEEQTPHLWGRDQ